jgi:hypothetical protein
MGMSDNGLAGSKPRRSLSAALTAAIAVCALGAYVDAAPPPAADTHSLDTVTVIAQKDRQELQRRVNNFVSSVIVRHNDWPYSRWKLPVCPLVAGLSREQGEFILTRVSQIANAAGVELGPEKCTGNFLVIFTRQPYELITKWRRKNPGMFDVTYGEPQFRRFLNSSKPVRVWYNAEFPDVDDTNEVLTGGVNLNQFYGSGGTRLSPSRLKWSMIRDINTAIMVVDSNRLQGLNFGQLADYIALVGLAEINLDKDFGDAPTILRLFTASGRSSSTGLTDWDQAFLKSVYSTNREDVLQLSEMKTRVLESIAPQLQPRSPQ